MADSADSCNVMFAFIAFFLVKGFERGIMKDGGDGGQPESLVEVGRTTFRYVGFGGLKLAGLVDGGVNAGVSGELIEGCEALDVADFSQDSSACGGADAWDRGDVLRGLLHPFGDGQIELSALLFEKIDLSQEAVHLDASCVGVESNPDRLAGLLLKQPGLFLTEAAMTGLG